MALTKIPSELSSTTGIVDNSNATAITIDSNENVGIGVVPEAWTYFSPLQAKRSSFAGSDGQTGVGYNWYFDGAYKYIANDYALAYQQNATSGVHSWSTAASGTAGATATLTERMRIDAAGRVTTPSQPTFNAYRNVNNYVFTSAGTFLCNATRHNVGNHFSTSTGRFTAPVAGVYHFTFHTIYYSTMSNGSVQLFKNGSGLAGTHTHFSSNQGSVWNHVVIATTVSLNANDYIEPYNSSGSAVTLHGGTWNHFAGYLIG